MNILKMFFSVEEIAAEDRGTTLLDTIIKSPCPGSIYKDNRHTFWNRASSTGSYANSPMGSPLYDLYICSVCGLGYLKREMYESRKIDVLAIFNEKESK